VTSYAENMAPALGAQLRFKALEDFHDPTGECLKNNKARVQSMRCQFYPVLSNFHSNLSQLITKLVVSGNPQIHELEGYESGDWHAICTALLANLTTGL